jgi:hypothetical protein
MISLTVMTVGIMAAMSTIATMQQARQYTSEQIRLQAIANAVMERLLTMPARDIANSATAPWTTQGDTAVTFAALEAANIIDRKANARNDAPWDVKNDALPGVYIRFYRGIGRPTFNAATGLPNTDPQTGHPIVDSNYPGVMDGGTWVLNPTLTRLSPNGTDLLSSYLYDPNDPLAATRNPVVIQVRVVSGDGIIELFTSRTL